MARVTGPLMSFDASGSIAGAVVFSKWRGRNYVRRHAVPSNPRTPAQLAARSIVAFCGSEWASLDPGDQATWLPGSESQKISPFNEYVKVNARNWRDLFCPSMAFPATQSHTPTAPTTIVCAVSGRQVSVDVSYNAGDFDWGLAFVRRLVTGVAARPSDVVHIANAQNTSGIFVDGPLAPGVYYYGAFAFTDDGRISAISAEGTATVV